MMQHRVRTAGDALAYITDCNLATVCNMACAKSRPKHEFIRQMSIAQTAINWMREMSIDMTSTRAADVPLGQNGVEIWAKQFMPELKETK